MSFLWHFCKAGVPPMFVGEGLKSLRASPITEAVNGLGTAGPYLRLLTREKEAEMQRRKPRCNSVEEPGLLLMPGLLH